MDLKQDFKDKEWIPCCAAAAESEKSDVSDSDSTLTTLSPQIQIQINNSQGSDGNDSRCNAKCSSSDEQYNTEENNNKINNETDNENCKGDEGSNTPLDKYVQKENYHNILENPTPSCSSIVINPSMNEEESSVVQQDNSNATRLPNNSVRIPANREPIRTRLSSGSITPISYSSAGSFRDSKSLNSPHDSRKRSLSRCSCCTEQEVMSHEQADHELKKKPALGKRKLATNSSPIPPNEVLHRVLKKRKNPARPCNSYAFFLMANWYAVKHAHPDDSFEDISKKISRMWSQLSSQNKKKFRNLFLRDRRRYKKQKEALTLYMDESDLYI